jgi:hypothetical protein
VHLWNDSRRIAHHRFAERPLWNIAKHRCQLTADVLVQWGHLTHVKDEALSPMAIQNGKTADGAIRASCKTGCGAPGRPHDHGNAFGALCHDMDYGLTGHTLEVNEPSRALIDFDALTRDAFVTAVQNAVP